MIEIIMSSADIKIASTPTGDRAIVAEDGESGIRVLIPVTKEGAAAIATALNGGIVLTKEMPFPVR